MPVIIPLRGFRDTLGGEQRRVRHVLTTAQEITARYGYAEWALPLLEASEIFTHTLGDTSDVVRKEMYTFDDPSGERVTLRPEGTAGVCRALVSEGLTQSLPQRVFYQGPMFRFERPQLGRYRQFQQVGIEALGPTTPFGDAESIRCAWDLLHALGIDATLMINTLGDPESRAAYRAALVAYLTPHRDALSPDSQARLVRNPLRILDSKAPEDQMLLEDAPRMQDYLTPDALNVFEEVQRYLGLFQVPFICNPRIVRGLDYYTHTTFEFVTTRLGSQGTVLGGGRYDGLVAQMGGPPVGGVGWAAGVERLAQLLHDAPAAPAQIVVMPLQAEMYGITLASELRAAGHSVSIDAVGGLKRRMERAHRTEATWVCIVGSQEEASNTVQVKHMTSGRQVAQPRNDVLRLLSQAGPDPLG